MELKSVLVCLGCFYLVNTYLQFDFVFGGFAAALCLVFVFNCEYALTCIATMLWFLTLWFDNEFSIYLIELSICIVALYALKFIV